MTSEDDERCWQELIKDVRRLPHDKPPLSGRKTELRVVPKISPDRVYRGAALADIVIGGTDNIDATFCPKSRLSREDFPTFGLPTMAIKAVFCCVSFFCSVKISFSFGFLAILFLSANIIAESQRPA